MTQKLTYQKEVSSKQREWSQFLRFMKKNPEALIGIADQTGPSCSLQHHHHSVAAADHVAETYLM